MGGSLFRAPESSEANPLMSTERIAIVGMGGVFPGATDLAGFWQNVAHGVDSGRAASAERWFLKPERALAAGGPQPDRVYSTWCCPLDDAALEFDPAVLPQPAIGERLGQLDPLFRIGLKAAHQAWTSAGSPNIDPSRAGVILGHIVLPTESTSALARDVLVQDFAAKLLGDRAPQWQPSKWNRRNWSAAGLPAALIAGALGLRGTAFTLDAACASSLYALKLACDELRAGRADVMLAGGLSRPDCQYTQMGFAQLQALTRRGRCAPLSAAADGLVVGEGAGIFVLKRLGDALRDGDRIAATIAGIGLSNDRGANLLAPHSEGQLRAMQAAYQQAGWRPGDVDLIECHATGTPIGDAVELDSLHTLWHEETGQPRRCVLGSVKSNVGHLLTGAGGASLMKMLWALQQQTLPPTANFIDPAPALNRADSPFQVLAQSQRWEARDDKTPRRAAINAFGFGGINAHVLLEEVEGLGLRAKGQRHTEDLSATVSLSSSVPQPLALSSQPSIAIVGLAARCGSLTRIDDIAARFFGTGSSIRTDIAEVATPVGEFRIPPLELEEMLPQQQLMLHVAAAALDDAHCGRDLGNRTGVFVGINLDPNTTNFHGRWSLEEFAPDWGARLGWTLSPEEMTAWVQQLRDVFGPPLTPNRVMGNLGGIVASRLAREFDVGGPSFTLSSDETSGVQALQVAVRSLQQGELDRALVGAVDFQCDVRLANSAESTPAASEQPGCSLPAPLPGDAAVAFILKRHEDAVRDGDRIYALVTDVTSSSSHSQLSTLNSPPPHLETDLGHCGAATGLLACLKSTLSLHHRVIPPTTPGDPHGAQAWLHDRINGPRTSTTTVTAADGTHVVVTLQAAANTNRTPPLSAGVFVFDGDTPQEILTAMDQCRPLITDDITPHRAAQRWFHQRRPDAQRKLAAVIVASSSLEWHAAADQLRATLTASPFRPPTTDHRPPAFFTPTPLGNTGRIAFVFPGSGNHFLGMGKELLAAFPQVLQQQDAENERLASQYQPDLIWNGPSTDAIGRDHKAMIFGQVALGTAVCDWLALFGVRPTAAMGYSLGESAALFGLRAWTDRDEMLRRMEASTLFGSDLVKPFDAARQVWAIPQGQEVPWLSGVVDRSAIQVSEVLQRRTRVYLLIVNTPTQCVIGGDRTQVEALVRDLQATFVPFPAPSTVHCELLQPVAKAYVALHLMRTTPPVGVDFYSAATGLPYGLSEQSAAGAILAQARGTVDFPAVIERAYADGVRLFVEIGPGSSCTRMIDDILGERPHWARPVMPATADPVTHALRVLGELITHRVPVDLSLLYGSDRALLASRLLRSSRDASNARCVITKTTLPDWQLAPLTQRPQSQPVVSPVPVLAPASAPLRPKESPIVPLRSPAPSSAVQNDPAPARWDGNGVEGRGAKVEGQKNVPVTLMERSLSASNPQPSTLNSQPVGADSTVTLLDRWMTERIAAHETFLRFSTEAQRLAAEWVSNGDTETELARDAKPQADVAVVPTLPRPVPSAPVRPVEPPRSLNYDQCMEFAIGKIGNVLGEKFAAIDAYPTRVRLPDVPLMLVDRILHIEGEPLSMTHGRVVTEHDIHADDWYLDCGKIPTCLAVESGQADLFLSGWLGIDFITRGLASYRLLDAVVTFHDALPGPGNTIHYDIKINRFFQQGDTYLFRFEFDATVDGRPLLTMRDGVAGFFTMAELAAGQGIVHTALDKQPRPGKRPENWLDPVPMAVESYSDAQLTALRHGDLAACFGPVFAGLPLHHPVTLPSGRLNLVHRVLELDPSGGKFGMGKIRAEADIHPDDWFLTCHFCDDQVMPGTLMYECCLHTLRIFLLRMGWIGEAGQIDYEPVPGVKSRLKCRGQVLASTKKVWYEVTLKEVGEGLGLRAEGLGTEGDDESLYCIADALMYADGKAIVEITDMSVRLTGLSRVDVEALWSGEPVGLGLRAKGLGTEENADAQFSSPSLHPKPLTLSQPLSLNPQPLALSPLFDTARITAFAIGKPSEAFGDRYKIFDNERVIARLPGPPFQFLDRIVSIENCEPWKLAAGGVIEAEYDVPADAWYFAANRQRAMPFAVLLEAALQPCGWLAGYLGSALTSDSDLSFRNLGGTATQYEEVYPDSGTLTTTVKMTAVSQSAGMIIQHYTFDLRCNGRPVYVGKTYFGFFSKAALENQVGIRDAAVYQPTDEERQRGESFPLPTEPPFPDDQFRMVKQVDLFVPDGGPHGFGYIRGSVNVDPELWFFKAHFYQDPVWPGSLGLESFLQLLKVYVARRWGSGLGRRAKGLGTEENADAQFSSLSLSPQPLALSHSHEWIYRGQVIPRDKTVTVEVVVTAVDDDRKIATADGFLTVDGRVIYQMKQFTLALCGPHE